MTVVVGSRDGGAQHALEKKKNFHRHALPPPQQQCCPEFSSRDNDNDTIIGSDGFVHR